MKFSILITSYNKGQYLEECIKSCLEQTNRNFEIIICDNYSDDDSDQIFEKYKRDIRLIKKKRDSSFPPINQIESIKEGFSNITGDVVCLLDADDYFLPKKLEILQNEISKKKKF